jgi:hypothetical protein
VSKHPKRCPHCDGDLRPSRKVSVSGKAYAVMLQAAKERGWTLARLIEEATRDV